MVRAALREQWKCIEKNWNGLDWEKRLHSSFSQPILSLPWVLPLSFANIPCALPVLVEDQFQTAWESKHDTKGYMHQYWDQWAYASIMYKFVGTQKDPVIWSIFASFSTYKFTNHFPQQKRVAIDVIVTHFIPCGVDIGIFVTLSRLLRQLLCTVIPGFSDHLLPTTAFRARTVSHRNCTANSDHLPRATSDRVFRTPSACFPCVERPCDDPKPPFLRSSPTKVWWQAKKRSGRKTHLSISRFERCLCFCDLFFFPVTSFVESFALLQ